MAKPKTTIAKLGQKLEPFDLNGFTLTSTGVIVPAGVRPSFSQFQGTFDFATRAHNCSGFWLVDLITYADTRQDWKDKIDHLVDAEFLTEKSVKQYRYLGKHMLPTDERVEGVGLGKHAIVASIELHDEQKEWLEKARDEGWSDQDLKEEIRAAARVKVIDGQAKLQGMYRVIYADPPWKYGDSGATKDGSLGKAERHYLGMTIEELCRLPVQAHAMPDSILFMWVTSPLLLQKPGPRDVLDAWGFEYKSSYVWDKVLGNRGHYNHVVHEFLIIATRGSCVMDVPTPQPKSVQTIRRSDVHSAKPIEFRRLIEKHWIRGPYLELFARERSPKWDCFGHDARLWGQELDPKHMIKEEDVPL